MIEVSVIIPIYNAGRYLQQCLDSVRNQTLKNIEIICVNDGSTDDSLFILQSAAQIDNRIIVVSQEKSTAGAARNRGLEMASGKYLSFLDADDFFEECMLEKAYKRAEKSNADIVVFRSDRYDERLGDFTESNWTIKAEYLPNKKIFSHRDMQGIFNCFVGWAWDKLFRTEFTKKTSLKFQNQRSINDLLFVYGALAKAERISIVNEILVHKRYNNKDSITANYSKSKDLSCFYNALLSLKKELEIWEIYEELQQDYVNYALSFTLWNLHKLKETEEFQSLYNLIKERGLKEMDILQHSKEFFYKEHDYTQLKKIIEIDYDSYRQYVELIGKDGTYLFPFELVKCGSNVIIYGAGNVGKAFYRQVKFSNYSKIVAWCDKRYQSLGNGYRNPKEIVKMKFDAVVIAINDENIAKKIILDLESMGVEPHRIIWRKPEIEL